MALTPLTSATTYATNLQFLERYDVRTVADLLSDSDTTLTTSQVQSSTRLTTLLQQASGDIEAACVAGLRYLPTDLQALLTNGGTGAEYLIGLTCDLAMWKLMNRRPSPVATSPPGPAAAALEALQLLRGGERILAFQEAGNAGVEVDIEQPCCTITTTASRYFGFPDCNSCCGT
jgi:hypothetical protein